MFFIKLIGWALAWLVALICVIWAFGALYFDFPVPVLALPVVSGFLAALIIALIFVRGVFRKFIAVVVPVILVMLWWFTLQPPGDREWQPDVSQTAWAEIGSDGDTVTLHNVRNCDYRTESDYSPRWETRTVRLRQMAGMDLAITYWGSPLIAHPIVSFRFNDTTPVCFSIEVRKTVGQTYSAIRGFYRQFNLIYLVSDERDVVRLRTNYRPGEDVYLYRTLASPDQARGRFREYLKTLNRLREQPRWYNAITTNCTTSIRAQRPAGLRTPWDWRILANGKGDEMLYERRAIATGGLPFNELKERSHINQKARAADQDPEFSRRIREGVPGFAEN